MNLRFAFAVNNDKQFERKHFGDADKYLIYKLESNKLLLHSEELNNFKLLDEELEHGSKRKGNAIINFLKKKKVNVLVSQQFGKNIQMINEHFIPIKIFSQNPDEVKQIISKHLHWIEDEWKHGESAYKLFTIKAGILKSSIKKNK